MIRKFALQDIDQVMEIWLSSNIEAHSFVTSEYWTANAEGVREQLLKAELYVCEQEQKVVGFVGLVENYLAGIFVDRDLRSSGVGKSLLDYVKGLYTTLSLHVYKRNKRAIDFYLREGFAKMSEELDEETNQVEYLMTWDENSFAIRDYESTDVEKL